MDKAKGAKHAGWEELVANLSTFMNSTVSVWGQLCDYPFTTITIQAQTFKIVQSKFDMYFFDLPKKKRFIIIFSRERKHIYISMKLVLKCHLLRKQLMRTNCIW